MQQKATDRRKEETWAGTTISVSTKDLFLPFLYQNSQGVTDNAPTERVYILAHELVHAWQNTALPKNNPVPSWPGVPGQQSQFETDAVRFTNRIRRENGKNSVRIQYSSGGPRNLDTFEGRDE